uniref:Uncharacterized protein n=1 Tax=Sander lucioperca TaxID=283035 RepID=A0A8C9Y674_SANLU
MTHTSKNPTLLSLNGKDTFLYSSSPSLAMAVSRGPGRFKVSQSLCLFSVTLPCSQPTASLREQTIQCRSQSLLIMQKCN